MIEQQLKTEELISLNTAKVNESNYSGNYTVETDSKNITATLSYPTPKNFDRHTTMALSFNGDTGVIVTYNFNEETDVNYLLELIQPSDLSQNYWYTPGSNQYQVLLQDNIRLFLQKNSIEELYTVLNKIKGKLLELGYIK
ncbi:hypothetical protein [Lysinibacillus fusiformis]|uniref:hypothetical protein n=1 Tax=Lysinibacillus fusiformis TaxID=28031 RepID=UPI001EF54D3F|nr:hypothetical protein [Lysinibacillus fusiformis]MCG7435582.1 hypothetical protein [Lysinibacillus fusiformis]